MITAAVRMFCGRGTASSDECSQRQVLRAVALSLLTRYWRRLPVAQYFAAPVMLFFAAERLLGTKQAAVLSGLALWQPVAPWIVYGLDLWRTRCEPSMCPPRHCPLTQLGHRFGHG